MKDTTKAKLKQAAKDYAPAVAISGVFVVAAAFSYNRYLNKRQDAYVDFLNYKGELFATALNETTDAILYKITNA